MSTLKASKFSLALYEFLRGIYSEEESRNAVELADTFVEQKIDEKITKVATTEDLTLLKSAVQVDILKLELKIAKNKSDLLNWVLVLFLILFGMIIGLYFRK